MIDEIVFNVVKVKWSYINMNFEKKIRIIKYVLFKDVQNKNYAT